MTFDMPFSFLRRCVSDIVNGLTEGLTLFSGTSRSAVLFALKADDPLMLCDPQNLLKGHEPIFNSLYVASEAWRSAVAVTPDKRRFAEITPLEDIHLAGLLSYGGYSGSVFFQRWFTEHHPDICSTGPTERWLEHATWRLSHDLANENELYTGISGYFLKEYATHAVRDHIVDEMNRHLGMDSLMRIYPMMDAVLKISGTLEEGNWPKGQLMFVDPEMVGSLHYLVKFKASERPQLANTKHVRKLLLAVESSSRRLVSDGRFILGICDAVLPRFSIRADFRGQHGFLKVNKNKVCSFADGRFSSSTHQAKLVLLEELLLDSRLHRTDSFFLFKIVSSLVHHAQIGKYGCTIVLDLNRKPIYISGQKIQPPLDIRKAHTLNLAKSLARVDGALHIGGDMHLHGFSCLLDGKAFAGEDRARGARYNSALRFTAEHDNLIVVVVSSDRPVSVIHKGMDVQGSCAMILPRNSVFPLDRLDSWVGS
ncbi:MAG: DNA-binding protein [Desulfobulbus propionicus]|nr:MAG: DNA-binding protein [Desulfobulbus propionicus]